MQPVTTHTICSWQQLISEKKKDIFLLCSDFDFKCNYSFSYQFFFAHDNIGQPRINSIWNSDNLDWNDFITLSDILGNKRVEKTIEQTEQNSLWIP